MFNLIAQVLLILVLFLSVRFFTYQITEVWGLPTWLNYKPFNCQLCLTFWTLLAVYLTVGFALEAWVTMYGGIALAILNAIAMWINQKNKTIKI